MFTLVAGPSVGDSVRDLTKALWVRLWLLSRLPTDLRSLLCGLRTSPELTNMFKVHGAKASCEQAADLIRQIG